MYRVNWYLDARDEMTELWLNGDAAFRAELTRLVADIERLLARNPHGVGESRDGNDRIIFIGFVVLYVEVYTADATVWVSQIKLW